MTRPNEPVQDQCREPTEEFTLKIPCRLAERAAARARETGGDVTGIVIEALDRFLRQP